MGLWMVLSSPLGLTVAAGIILLIAYLIYRYLAKTKAEIMKVI